MAAPILFTALLFNILFRKKPLAVRATRMAAFLGLAGYYVYLAQGEMGRNIFIMSAYGIGFLIAYFMYFYIDKKTNFD